MHAATLDELVTLVEPRMAGGLGDPESLGRVRDITRSLPASLAGYFGFERRLGLGNAGMDFAFSLSPYGLDWLVASKRWPQLCALAASWRAKYVADVPAAWLEFDTGRDVQVASPNLFISINRADAGEIGAHLPDGAKAALPILESCIDAAPASVDAVQIGFMFARAAPDLRLCAVPMSYEDLRRFLNEIAWPGNFAAVADVVEPYASVCDAFGVDVDVFERVRPSVGLELLYDGKPRDRQIDREPRWFALFDRLVGDGLCSSREHDALIGWVSQRTFTAPLVDRLIAAAVPRDQALLHGTLYTGLQHIKLTFDPGGAVAAKAYFGAVLDSDR